MITSYTAGDYLSALQALMPRGAAWPRDPGATQTAVLGALAQTPARLDAAAVQLVADAFPATTVALLPEWEASLGLPDLVVGPAPTTAKRQRAVVARLAGQYGFSRTAITGFAKSLGYDVALSAVIPFRASQGTIGQRLAGNEWANTVTLTLTPSASPPFTDALGAWDLAFCKAGLTRMAPAHLTVLFT